jgi:mRNA-degrading endonuclease RelE of RelBE toxin-antitoxin system
MFRVHFTEPVRDQLDGLPASTVEQLANHLKAIAELADLWPILYSGDEVKTLRLNVGDVDVRYSVDVPGKALTVKGLTQLLRGNGP